MPENPVILDITVDDYDLAKQALADADAGKMTDAVKMAVDKLGPPKKCEAIVNVWEEAVRRAGESFEGSSPTVRRLQVHENGEVDVEGDRLLES